MQQAEATAYSDMTAASPQQQLQQKGPEPPAAFSTTASTRALGPACTHHAVSPVLEEDLQADMYMQG